MIQIQDTTIKVEFGTNERATIAVIAKHGTLTLQMIAADKKIGESITEADNIQLPKVEIEFFLHPKV